MVFLFSTKILFPVPIYNCNVQGNSVKSAETLTKYITHLFTIMYIYIYIYIDNILYIIFIIYIFYIYIYIYIYIILLLFYAMYICLFNLIIVRIF